MFIVLGATGHVGSVVAASLLEAREPVTIVVRNADKAAPLRAKGAKVVVADLDHPDDIRAAFRRGKRAFLLNPPADTSTDTDVEEHRTIALIMQALEDSGLEHVVAESTYGAQPGHRCGDFNTLYDFEQALRKQPIPATVLRAAYYMSNWDLQLDDARKGLLPTLYPRDLAIPMVAPADLGHAAARLLRESIDETSTHYVEGPERYSAADVAAAFAKALKNPVELSVIPRSEWEKAYRKLGFSAAAASSYARMTAVSVDGGSQMPEHPERGTTSLEDYIAALARR